MRDPHRGDAGAGEDRVDLAGRPDRFLWAGIIAAAVDRIGGGWKWTVAVPGIDDPYTYACVAGLQRRRDAHQRWLAGNERAPMDERQLQPVSRRRMAGGYRFAATSADQQGR